MTLSSKHRDLLLVIGYIAAVLLCGALLAPVLFFAAQSYMGANPEGWLAKELHDKEFPTYFNRAALVAALVGLWPLLKAMRMEKEGVLGNRRILSGWQNLPLGFILGAGFLLLMGFVFYKIDAHRIRPVTNWLWLSEPLLSAFTVSFLEEFLFRGAILGVLCRSLGTRSGLWWTTLIFAAVHFLKPPADGALANDQVSWLSGFWVVSQLFRGFGEVEFLLEEFLTLAAVGFVLGWVRLRSGSLWGSIGLHAGWVFGLKYFSHNFRTSPALRRGEWVPWIGENLKIGVTPFVVVLLTGVVMILLLRRKPSVTT